ncbi:MAG: hypothetical protein GXO69_00150 [Acidobacteria bacterium]|nr:hypothetical protein [Acidobacteriota bacterium]
MKSVFLNRTILIAISLWLGIFASVSAKSVIKAPAGVQSEQSLPNSRKTSTLATKPVKLPKTASPGWWAKVQRNIQRMEYNASKMASSNPLIGKAAQAPNRAQNFRTWFLSDRIVVYPRTDKKKSWQLTLRLLGAGNQNNFVKTDPEEPETEKNRVTYPDSRIEQWFENRQEGLEQGFTIPNPLSDSSELSIRIRIEGNLT